MTDQALLQQIKGFSLTTAEILYRLPDYPELLQSYVWQDYDKAPEFPCLTRFLTFWSTNLEGPLYRVRVAHHKLVGPRDFQFQDGEFRLH